VDGEPFDNAKVKALLLRCLDADGSVFFTPHALREMAKDNITQPQAIGVLRGGRVDGCDLIEGTWRYRLHIAKVFIVSAFDSETRTVVVTGWRKKP
jgi:hypothetical protein